MARASELVLRIPEMAAPAIRSMQTDLEDFDTDSQHDGHQFRLPHYLGAAEKNTSNRKCISSSRISCQWIARLSGRGVGKS